MGTGLEIQETDFPRPDPKYFLEIQETDFPRPDPKYFPRL
jgi:hypothetical protein